MDRCRVDVRLSKSAAARGVAALGDAQGAVAERGCAGHRRHDVRDEEQNDEQPRTR
jgi:hypothetical protein